MELEDLGYNSILEKYRIDQNLQGFKVGRVISEHKERYIVKNTEKEYDGEVIGNLRFTANSRSDFPAVGDWVAFSEYNEDDALIHAILPRRSVLERQAVGQHGEKQIIATNIDYALIIQAVDRDFNINRIERYLTICHSSKVEPVVVLTKTDLVDDDLLKDQIGKISERIPELPVFTMSMEDPEALKIVKDFIHRGKTYCLLGSSGAGKSTLTNLLSEQSLMKTSHISSSTQKGRHTTSHRELLVLESGGVIIDNPGIREVGITDSSEGLETTFEMISRTAEHCRFNDCTHTNETGCAVISAVDNGEIDKASYENYLRMEREKAHFEETIAEKRKKGKAFNKMIRDMKSTHSKYKK
ncbi:ribosome small subunit-dependent GTPase A [Robertkochia solimangrovi]|uniref:ribosome small subunit-dependent GTPase A n=1 Tax=Robertkochia solimangrovi TaxID=2213046 RepID=UPI00117C1D65|nr:ribosome small subunit-dependent GTPase A [Robertkochia solimangrovi]TRZ42220.1 ribosome small subunit-dependent GTPase A [Robertkochia solimangrovi]